jgi:spore coat protein A, manganese oxidase
MKRRGFLKLAGAAAGGVLAAGARASAQHERPHFTHLTTGLQTRHRHHKHKMARPSHTACDILTKFVDRLPIMPTISPRGIVRGVPQFDVTMRPFEQRLHRDLPATQLWGYNGRFPGPTFDVRRGHPIAVDWKNDLPSKHPLPIDFAIHGAETDKPDVRTVVHLHGAKVMPDSDGYPEAWFTRNFAATGPFFKNRTYHYPNDQRATTLWYHDHALGITRLNVYSGLAGMYLLRDDVEDSFDLPSGQYEVPLMIQDRILDPDGSLIYPVQVPGDPDDRVPKVWIPEFFGDVVLVNGKVWPYLDVEPRPYRFRMLNASNARFYRLTLAESNELGSTNGRVGPRFVQIGSDGGLLDRPVSRDEILIAPAERFDVVVDFSSHAGRNFVLRNDAPAPFPDGDDVVPPDVMLFRVDSFSRGRHSVVVPSSFGAVPFPDASHAAKVRDLVLSELDSAEPFENPIIALINDAYWDDPVTENPRVDSTEIWRVINTTGDAHPIHIHLVQFQILDRQPFDPDQYPQKLVFTGPRVPASEDERHGLKDTVKSLPGEVVRLAMTFDLPGNARLARGEKLRYVFHCHILEHEENEMMRPYDVVG